MEVPHWGEPVESYETDPAGGRATRTVGLVLLAIGGIGVAWLVSRTDVGLFDDGLFLLPAFSLAVGAAWVLIGSSSRLSMWVGEDWYAQRFGLVDDVRGFRFAEVARVRTTTATRVRGRLVVSLVVESFGGQRHKVPVVDVPESLAARAALARGLLGSGADLDPSADELLRSQLRAGSDPLQAGDPGGDVVGAPRLDADGRLRWPEGTGVRMFRGVALTVVGGIGLVLAAMRLGAFRDELDPGLLGGMVATLLWGAIELVLLVRQRRRDLTAWRDRAPAP